MVAPGFRFVNLPLNQWITRARLLFAT